MARRRASGVVATGVAMVVAAWSGVGCSTSPASAPGIENTGDVEVTSTVVVPDVPDEPGGSPVTSSPSTATASDPDAGSAPTSPPAPSPYDDLEVRLLDGTSRPLGALIGDGPAALWFWSPG